MKSPAETVYFAPVVAPLFSGDHFSGEDFSIAYSLPVGVTGIFSPLEKKQVELWTKGWDKPIRLDIPVEGGSWDAALYGLDRLLHHCDMYRIQVPGFRLHLEGTDPSIDVLSLLVPLVLNYLGDTVQEFSTPLRAQWIERVMPGISCTAQAYGWADLSSDHIFLYNREEDTCVIAPDPLSGWQKILIGVPGPFRAISEKNTVLFGEWVETIHEENTSHYFHCLRQLSLYTGNIAVQNMLSRLGGHEAQGISLPLSEGHHHYLLTYVHPRALSPFLDFCERNCKTVFGSGYAIRVIDGLKD